MAQTGLPGNHCLTMPFPPSGKLLLIHQNSRQVSPCSRTPPLPLWKSYHYHSPPGALQVVFLFRSSPGCTGLRLLCVPNMVQHSPADKDINACKMKKLLPDGVPRPYPLPLLWEHPRACQPQLTQAPLPGHLAGSRLGLPSIFRYRAVSVLLWAACFFTSLESSAWIVCKRWVSVGLRTQAAAANLTIVSEALPFWAPGHFGAKTTGT